jgi:voltage-gated potassium channel
MSLRADLHQQITIGSWPDGKLTGLNILLIWMILAAVIVGVFSTEPEIMRRWHEEILIAEIAFGAFFLVEYLARIYAAPETPGDGSDWSKRWQFIRSPIGLVDLAVVIVSLAPFFIANAAALRLLRLLRVFSLAKLGHFSAAMREILGALKERSYDLLVCAALAFSLLLVGASGLYWLEGHLQPDNFGSIPRALWWAIITLTTVGYGDAYPITAAGKMVGSLVALGGVLLVALPTGIFAAAFSDAMQRRREALAKAIHDLDEIG